MTDRQIAIKATMKRYLKELDGEDKSFRRAVELTRGQFSTDADEILDAYVLEEEIT